jgi:HK97 family phage major capsid protein
VQPNSTRVEEIKAARDSLEKGDGRTNARIDGIEQSLNALFKKVNRPGAEAAANDNEVLERKSAIGLCRTRRALTVPKIEAGINDNYEPSSSEIDEGLNARKGLRSLWRHGDVGRLDALERKSLMSLSYGSNAFIMPPEMATQALSCLTDPTDLAALVNTVQISAPSIKFFIDNVRLQTAAWACEASCFANNPQPDLTDGLGELEIKAESLRYIVCAGRDLLSDSAFNIEAWILRKVSDGFRDAISSAIIGGDGLGKPIGILNPNAGIPILDTSASTPPGQCTWQDLVGLKYDVPMQWHNGGAFVMNQRTLALLMSMSDAIGRPLWAQLPGGMPGLTVAGSPIQVVSQMPDVVPGSTPIAFGNLRQAYTLVNRSATTVMPDPYTAQWCLLFRFEARVGGAVKIHAAKPID